MQNVLSFLKDACYSVFKAEIFLLQRREIAIFFLKHLQPKCLQLSLLTFFWKHIKRLKTLCPGYTGPSPVFPSIPTCWHFLGDDSYPQCLLTSPFRGLFPALVCFALWVLCIYHQIPRTRVLYEIDVHIRFGGSRGGLEHTTGLTSRLNIRDGAEQISFARLTREWLSLSSPFSLSYTEMHVPASLLFFF